jgi:hypothetical protein
MKSAAQLDKEIAASLVQTAQKHVDAINDAIYRSKDPEALLAAVSEAKKHIATMARLQKKRGKSGVQVDSSGEFDPYMYELGNLMVSANERVKNIKKLRSAEKRPNVTSQNLDVLKQAVLKHRSGEFPRGYWAAKPHVKRCIAAGLAELVDKNGEVTPQIFKGTTLRLTPVGRDAIADAIIADIERATHWTVADEILVPMTVTEKTKVTDRLIKDHEAEVQRLEETLENLRRGK